MSPPSPPESIVRGAAFEALLVRMLQPAGRFAEALRAAGYDPGAPPRAEYPRQVWIACVELARRHVFPNLPPADGMQQLGRRFIECFRQTLMGKMLAATLPILGPATAMQRLPRMWASSQPQLRIHVQELAPCDWAVTFEEPGLLGHFYVGQLEALLVLLRASRPEVTLGENTPQRCVLRVRWSE
jgi:uncharacterized protein (TIGR02265 family)